MTLKTIQEKLAGYEDMQIVRVSHGECRVNLELQNGVIVTHIANGTFFVDHPSGNTAAVLRVLDVLSDEPKQDTARVNVVDSVTRELDRRIANVEKVAEWREKIANDSFESFKKRIADLTISELATGHLNSVIQETIAAYNCWSLTVAELQQLKAFKEDIEKGRVSFDG